MLTELVLITCGKALLASFDLYVYIYTHMHRDHPWGQGPTAGSTDPGLARLLRVKGASPGPAVLDLNVGTARHKRVTDPAKTPRWTKEHTKTAYKAVHVYVYIYL